ncbi:hypothetical protein ACFQV2_29315 [Actinokineospora soli]|uniref:Uncharacterized protein n=1 Tax=Actinokineospora soli TaxID=1048753 RepID=A0ABW2TSX7_9PSEU
MLDAKAAGAALVGGAAVAAYALWPTGRPVVAALLVVAGLVLWRVGTGAVERGAGQAAVVVGAGLAGQVLVVAVEPREFGVAVVLAPVVVALAVLRGPWGGSGWGWCCRRCWGR